MNDWNQLAHYLRKLGVGRESLIAFAIESSVETVIVMLGILKSGAAYVPLDLSYPSERIQFMLQDTNTPIVLTNGRSIDNIPTLWRKLYVLTRCGIIYRPYLLSTWNA